MKIFSLPQLYKPVADSLRSFFDEIRAPDPHLVVLNHESPYPIRRLLDSMRPDLVDRIERSIAENV